MYVRRAEILAVALAVAYVGTHGGVAAAAVELAVDLEHGAHLLAVRVSDGVVTARVDHEAVGVEERYAFV